MTNKEFDYPTITLSEKMRGAWGRRWKYRWARLKKWFLDKYYG